MPCWLDNLVLLLSHCQRLFVSGIHVPMPVGADRECDPDLCMQCQWTICGQKPPGTLDCHNMKLRLRQHKRVAMGLSHVAGWGAFAQVTTRLLISMWPCLQSLHCSCCTMLQCDMRKSKFDEVVVIVQQCLTWHETRPC